MPEVDQSALQFGGASALYLDLCEYPLFPQTVYCQVFLIRVGASGPLRLELGCTLHPAGEILVFNDDMGDIFRAIALRFPVVESDERQFFVHRFRQ